MEKKRWPSTEVQVIVRAVEGALYQQLWFPDGTFKRCSVSFGNMCDEGMELYNDLVRSGRDPIFRGTQRGWHYHVNNLLASRGQIISFPEY